MAASHVPVPLNAQAIVRTGGGGGWGDPLEREASLVRDDVIEEFISAKSAREDYGVVLRPDGTVDAAATERQRGALKAKSRTA
jgi:N-methylhydantoinase B